MSTLSKLQERSSNICELCTTTDDLKIHLIAPDNIDDVDKAIYACKTCIDQVEEREPLDINHWRCLSGSIWNENIPVQVMAYRMLTRLSDEGWAQDLKEQMYLDDEALEWAKAVEGDEDELFAKDSNGAKLVAGDSVTLIKDLEVKGANFTAKRGTLVKNISINGIEGQIEGRVNGTHIVLLTKFLKKAN